MGSVVQYLERHRVLTAELISLYKQHAHVAVNDLNNRRQAWDNSTESTISGRTITVDYTVADTKCELFKLDGEIKATLAELKHVELCLTHLTHLTHIARMGS